MSDCPVPILDFSNPVHSSIVTTITNLVRNIIHVQDSLTSAAGRSRETLEQRKEDLDLKVKAQFDLIWSFDGLDMNILLPGETPPQD